MIYDNTIEWLMQGDPAIRWQTLRDVIGADEAEWMLERQRVEEEGWGADLLHHYDSSKHMWGNGLYAPKWTSSTYTLLSLIEMGLRPDHPVAREGAAFLVDELLGPEGSERFEEALRTCDLCIVGMLIRILSYFEITGSRLNRLVVHALEFPMSDGGWNCRCKRRKVVHSSLHTTFNVLEGLREYRESHGDAFREEILQAEQGALEFTLLHRLFKSDKTGQIIKESFTKFSYPFRWYYDVLRGLDYFQSISFLYDPRLGDAIELLRSKRTQEGVWALGKKHPGEVFSHMEAGGKPSRWNTLRAMRVLRAYDPA